MIENLLILKPRASATTSTSVAREVESSQSPGLHPALRKSADWRKPLVGAGLAALVVVITLGGFRIFTPSVAESRRLCGKQQQLRAAIELLASHGGRAELKNCGTSKEHL